MANIWQTDDLLRLSLLKKINVTNQFEIIEKYNDFSEFHNATDLPEKFASFRQKELFEESNLENLLNEQKEINENHKISVISYWDSSYPVLLKEVTSPPLLLFVKGELQKSDALGVAIVGTRKCSRYGKLTAERYSSAIANNNIVVISGLAYGIDTHAHKACIASKGITYAVIGSGIDKLGPSDAVEKSQQIIENGGAIISQFKSGTVAKPPYFLHRNRVIAGIASAVVIIESGERGGSLNTARHAAEQSKDVFAVPGNIISEKSVGTNRLIKYGSAMITTKPEDVLEAIGAKQTKAKILDIEIKFNNDVEKRIYSALSLEPIQIDTLAAKTNLEISTLLVALLELEFRGIIRQLPGKNYVLP